MSEKHLVESNGNKTPDVSRAFTRPRVDVLESEAEFLLVADVPGVAKDGVEVRFEEGQLTVEAKRNVLSPASAPKAQQAPQAPQAPRAPQAAAYRCAFTVPDGIDADKISAELEAGVLSVHIPKAASRRARRIDVRTA